MPRAHDLSNQRLVNTLRSVLGLAPLYETPIVTGERVVITEGRDPNVRIRPGRVLGKGQKPGTWVVDVDGHGPLEFYHEKIDPLSTL